MKQRENAKKKAEKVRPVARLIHILISWHRGCLEPKADTAGYVQAASAPAQPQAKVSAAEAEEELSPNVSLES